EGTLAKIVVPEGTADVPVNQLIAVLAGEGEDASKVTAGAGAAPPAKAAAASSFETRPAGAPQDEAGKGQAPAQAPKTGPRPEEAAPAAVSKDVAPATNGRGRIFSSPLARRLAKEAGIDIARIAGTGPHGRVVARDIAAAKEGKGLKAPAAAPSAGAAPTVQLPSDDKIRALYEDGSYEVIPHDNMRRVIA